MSWATYGSASAELTDSLRTFVVKFSHSWLPIGVRERRCSTTTDLCPQCTEIETVLIYTAARPEHRGVIDF
jgi:hypothetical protein